MEGPMQRTTQVSQPSATAEIPSDSQYQPVEWAILETGRLALSQATQLILHGADLSLPGQALLKLHVSEPNESLFFF